MPSRISITLFLEKATVPSLIPPNKLEQFFFNILTEELVLKIKRYKNYPFTISYPKFYSHPNDLITQAQIEISILDDEIFPLISSLILQNAKKHKFGDVNIKNIKIKSLENTPFEDFLNEFELVDEISFDFITPTSFERHNINYPLPDPAIIYIDLMSKWNLFAPENLKINIEPLELYKFLHLTGAFVKTKHIEIKNYPEFVGFTGRIFIHFHTRSSLLIKKLVALSKFAEYSNLGKYTHLGFGKTIVL